MKKILFAIALFFTGAAFANTAEAPKLPDNIAEWKKVVDSTCDVKEGIVLHNLVYVIHTTETDTMNIVMVYEKNGVMVYFMEGLATEGKMTKVSTMTLNPQGQWITLDETAARKNSFAFEALGVTEEEFRSCRMRQKHQ